MANLHMDVDATHALVAEIRSTSQQFQQQFASLSTRVDSTIGTTWIAPGAIVFQDEFRQCSIRVREVIEQMESLALRLQQETAEWMAMAQID